MEFSFNYPRLFSEEVSLSIPPSTMDEQMSMHKAFSRAFPGGVDALRFAIQQRISYAKQAAPFLSEEHYSRFDALGSVVQCPPSLVVAFGTGDDEKRICGSPQTNGDSCTVVSVGSNNQWGFELEVNKRLPHCTIHTLDCTVDAQVPQGLAHRLVFHKVCLSEHDHTRDGQRYMSWSTFSRTIGLKAPPIALKVLAPLTPNPASFHPIYHTVHTSSLPRHAINTTRPPPLPPLPFCVIAVDSYFVADGHRGI